jgi:hypothetical protein
MTYQTFTATLTDPSGYRSEYRVEAKNKTEARKEIARIYRRDTPPPSAGFYSFAQNRLTWEEELG